MRWNKVGKVFTADLGLGDNSSWFAQDCPGFGTKATHLKNSLSLRQIGTVDYPTWYLS